MVIPKPSFSESSVFKMFSFHTKNSSGLKSVFEKLRFRCFRDGLSLDGNVNFRCNSRKCTA